MDAIIDLHPWEYERGFAVGIARFTANWGRADARHYDRSRMEEDRNAQAAAALCEIAVARYVNEYAHLHVWHYTDRHRYRHLADVGDDIEVRRVRTASGVPVRRSDAGKRVFGAKLLDPEYRKVQILGFVLADEVIKSLTKDWCYVPFARLQSFVGKGSLSEVA